MYADCPALFRSNYIDVRVRKTWIFLEEVNASIPNPQIKFFESEVMDNLKEYCKIKSYLFEQAF